MGFIASITGRISEEIELIFLIHYSYMNINCYIYIIVYNNTMEVYKMKNIRSLLNNPYIKYPSAVISAIAIIKTGYDLGFFIIKLKYFYILS